MTQRTTDLDLRGLDERPSNRWRLRRRVFGQSIVHEFASLEDAFAGRAELDKLVRETRARRKLQGPGEPLIEMPPLPWVTRDLAVQVEKRASEVTRREDAIRTPDAPWLVEVTDLWLESIKSDKSSNTYTSYKSIVKAWLDWNGGREKHADASVFSRLTMAAWTTHCNNTLAGTTAHSRGVVISALWQWASDMDDTWPGIPRWRRPKRATKVKRAKKLPSPRLEEVDSVVRRIGGPDHWVAASLAFASRTGLRWESQVCRLRPDDFRLSTGEVVIQDRDGGPKLKGTDEERTLPLTPDMITLVAQWIERTEPSEYLWRRGAMSKASVGIKSAIKAATAAEELRLECWRRGKRGNRTSQLARSGFQAHLLGGYGPDGKRKHPETDQPLVPVDADVVRALVGHSRGTQARYVDSGSLPLREAIARIPPVDWGAPYENIVPLHPRASAG